MRIALIAHDSEKPEMIGSVTDHEGILAAHDLIATGTTGSRLNEGTGLEVTPLASGPLGGDLMIGSAVANDACDAVFFFRDPDDGTAPRAGRLGAVADLRRSRDPAGDQSGERGSAARRSLGRRGVPVARSGVEIATARPSAPSLAIVISAEGEI